AMIIIACYELESPIQLLDEGIFENIMIIFSTYSILKFIQATLDIAFTWKARQTMEYSEKFRQVVKLVVAAIWTIVLPVCYANSGKRYTCVSSQYGSWLDKWCFSSYMIAVGVYLVPNALEMVLFFVPAVRKYIEISNWQIFTIFSWTQ
ncbi:hypothetical protein UlMin_045363, partial [Ulmus minor]